MNDAEEDEIIERYVEDCEAHGPERLWVNYQVDRMRRLALEFPCLADAPGVRPWDAEALDRWAANPVSHGERVTAQFLLAVWSPETPWQSGRFDLMEALRLWSPSYREVFLAWANNPWWP